MLPPTLPLVLLLVVTVGVGVPDDGPLSTTPVTIKCDVGIGGMPVDVGGRGGGLAGIGGGNWYVYGTDECE